MAIITFKSSDNLFIRVAKLVGIINEKLDKSTTPSSVYTTDASGDQTMIPVSEFKDVLEFADLASFPATGEQGKIYVTLDTNFTYRWGGSAYVQIGGGGSSAFRFSFYQEGEFNTALFGGTNAGIWLKRYNAYVNYFGISTGVSDKSLIAINYSSQSYVVPEKCKINGITSIESTASDWEIVIFKSDNVNGVNPIEVFYQKVVSFVRTTTIPDVTINSGDYLHIFFKRPSAGQIIL